MSRQIRDAKKIGRVGGNRPWILTDRFGPEMAIFPTFFFLGSIGQENVFYDILERKNAFLGYKNKKFKKSKNWHFSNFFF